MLSDGTPIDLTLLFASDAYESEFPQILREVRKRTGNAALIGCCSQGIIGQAREVEDQPALALQVMSLPGINLQSIRLTPKQIEAGMVGANLPSSEVNAVLLFADPFSQDSERLLEVLSAAYPGLPLVGGLASGRLRGTRIFLNDAVLDSGAVGFTLGGAWSVRSVVSQGCAPIGQTWTITSVKENVIESIGMRPALEVLTETFQLLAPDVQQRAQRNIFVGLAMDEYRDDFRRGDFLVRNIVGVDRESGSIAIGAMPRAGQTLQFQLRDPQAADEDLIELLTRARTDLGGETPAAALLCSCNGRGVGLFGRPDHDAEALQAILGPLPVAGFFCNGEIGPVGGKNFLHGYTASVALIVPARPAV